MNGHLLLRALVLGLTAFAGLHAAAPRARRSAEAAKKIAEQIVNQPDDPAAHRRLARAT